MQMHSNCTGCSWDNVGQELVMDETGTGDGNGIGELALVAIMALIMIMNNTVCIRAANDYSL